MQTYQNFQILVIDNGSIDDSVDLLNKYQKKHSNKVDLIFQPKNLGFAGGVNVGIKWALDRDFDSVALFNNDAIADKDWLKSLTKAIKPDEVGIATGLLLHEDGQTIDSSGDWLSNWGLAFPRNRGDNVSKAPKEGFVFGASGGASLYRTDLFRDIGPFDHSFFAYYEDADISFRAQLAGWKVIYTPSAKAYHKQGATSKKIPGFTTYHTFKNLPLLFLKNVPSRLLLSVGIRFYFAYWLILLNAIVKGNGLSAIKGALMSFVLGFRVLADRQVVQGRRRVSSAYIKSILWDDLPPDQTGVRKLRQLFTGKR